MIFIMCPPFGIHNKLDVASDLRSVILKKLLGAKLLYFMQKKLEVNLKEN